ncbi:hypothetical protein PBRA_001034, partial [Plasmodiophora brassicae]
LNRTQSGKRTEQAVPVAYCLNVNAPDAMAALAGTVGAATAAHGLRDDDGDAGRCRVCARERVLHSQGGCRRRRRHRYTNPRVLRVALVTVATSGRRESRFESHVQRIHCRRGRQGRHDCIHAVCIFRT